MTSFNKGFSPEEINYFIRSKGLTFSDLDRKYNLPRGTTAYAARKPHTKGEQAIALELFVPASEVFPERYDPMTKERLSSQSHNKYKRHRKQQEKRSCFVKKPPCHQQQGGPHGA